MDIAANEISIEDVLNWRIPWSLMYDIMCHRTGNILAGVTLSPKNQMVNSCCGCSKATCGAVKLSCCLAVAAFRTSTAASRQLLPN